MSLKTLLFPIVSIHTQGNQENYTLANHRVVIIIFKNHFTCVRNMRCPNQLQTYYRDFGLDDLSRLLPTISTSKGKMKLFLPTPSK